MVQIHITYNHLRKLVVLPIIVLITLFNHMFAFAQSTVPSPPSVGAFAAVMIEAETGKVLFGKDERIRIYPASMTKVLTALVVLEHLELDAIVVVGNEVSAVPEDSSKAGNILGERITVHNLLRAALIVSGNESASILALAVARHITGDAALAYPAGERIFSELMNQKARDLGALNSNFVNPHGYHHTNLYSTVYDMAQICREAIKNDVIREIVATVSWTGNGAGENANPSWITKNYNLTTRNQLMVPGPYYYPYAIGMKTGRHSQAGDSFAAAAVKDGMGLIVVISNSPDPGRWEDTIALFGYGFDNFAHTVIQPAWTVIGEIPVLNPRKQDPEIMEYYITETVEALLRYDQLDRVVMAVTFDAELITDGPEYRIALKTPIAEGQVLGRVAFSADGEVLYNGYFTAARDAETRSFSTDVDYYRAIIVATFFSKQSVPYWIIAALSVIILGYIVFRLVKRNNVSRKYDRLFK